MKKSGRKKKTVKSSDPASQNTLSLEDIYSRFYKTLRGRLPIPSTLSFSSKKGDKILKALFHGFFKFLFEEDLIGIVWALHTKAEQGIISDARDYLTGHYLTHCLRFYEYGSKNFTLLNAKLKKSVVHYPLLLRGGIFLKLFVNILYYLCSITYKMNLHIIRLGLLCSLLRGYYKKVVVEVSEL